MYVPCTYRTVVQLVLEWFYNEVGILRIKCGTDLQPPGTYRTRIVLMQCMGNFYIS
jgi:hypothetical protein